jgi:hypothetical protein
MLHAACCTLHVARLADSAPTPDDLSLKLALAIISVVK